MRSLAITKRVLTELIRDKRTLALLFIAPILTMWLLSIMFNDRDGQPFPVVSQANRRRQARLGQDLRQR